MTALFITSILWLAGSIVLLWRTSVSVIRYRSASVFFPFFMAVLVMDATSAFIYYGAWMTDTWTVVRFLWLLVFASFFIMWFRLIKNI